MIIHLVKNLSNIPGWRSKRKIIVFESDDWGSIRMPSRESFDYLAEKGLDLIEGDSLRYNKYDTLANADDLTALYEVLSKFKDTTGHNAVFTAIALVANPDFERIAHSGFQEYHFEPFTATLKRYYGGDSVFKQWQAGIRNRLFMPQFHGREHLNVSVWMGALQQNDWETQMAFKQGLWGYNNHHPLNISYQAAFDLNNPDEISGQIEIIRIGTKLFEELFGYKATYFVPPNGPINNNLEKVAKDSGIEFISTAKIQQEALGHGKTRKVYHYLGQQNSIGQTYITRNAFFEPSQDRKDWVDSCLFDIKTAFKWKKPAVISTHRVNYIGVHDEKKRFRGLNQLTRLLKEIVKKWPEVEFMTSDELGKLIRSGK